MFNKRNVSGSTIAKAGLPPGDFSVTRYTSYIERLLIANYYDLIFLPEEEWKIHCIRSFLNEGFSLMGLSKFKNLENFYYRNLGSLLQKKLSNTLFDIAYPKDYDLRKVL